MHTLNSTAASNKEGFILGEGDGGIADFKSEDFTVYRTLQKKATLSNAGWVNKTKHQLSEKDILVNLEKLKTDAENFHCMHITAKAGDGASWLSERLCRNVLQDRGVNYAQYNLYTLSEYKNHKFQLNGLSQILKDKEQLRAAHKAGLIAGTFLLSKWSLALPVFVALLGYLVQVSINISSAEKLWSLALPVLLGLFTEYVKNRITENKATDGSQLKTDLKEAIEEASINARDKYELFIKIFVEKLCASAFPRIVVVDNYAVLDKHTKYIIERYFKEVHEKSRGLEFWIIFEHDDNNQLMPSLQAKGINKFVSQWYIEPLEDRQKQELVERKNLPQSRLGCKVIRAVIKGDKESNSQLSKKIDEYVGSSEALGKGELRKKFLLLLAINTVDINQFVFRLDLPKSLADGKKELCAKLLHFYLNVPVLSKDLFADEIDAMCKQADFVTIVETAAKKNPRLRLNSELLWTAQKHISFSETDIATAHLYWALFWYDVLKNPLPEPAWIKKLSYHLAESEIPSGLDNSLARKIRDKLFEARLFAAEICFTYGMFDGLPDLIEDIINNTEITERTEDKKKLTRVLQILQNALAVTNEPSLAHWYYSLSFKLSGKKTKDENHPLVKLYFDKLLCTRSLDGILTPAQVNRFCQQISLPSDMEDLFCLRAAIILEKLSTLNNKCNHAKLSEYTIDAAKIAIATQFKAATNSLILNKPKTDYVFLGNLKMSLITTKAVGISFETLLTYTAITEQLLKAANTKEKELLFTPLLTDICLIMVEQCAIAVLNKTVETAKVEGLLSNIDKLCSFNASQMLSQSNSEKIIRYIFTLYDFSEMLWQQFTCNYAITLNQIQRTEFAHQVLTREIMQDSNQIQILVETMLENLDLIMDINLTLAIVHSSSKELAGHYLSQSALLAIENNANTDITNILAIMALVDFEEPDYTTSKLTAYILDHQTNDNISVLDDYLCNLPDEYAFSTFWELYKTIESIEKNGIAELASKIQYSLISKLALIEDEYVKNEIRSFISYRDFLKQINEQEDLEVESTLEIWEGKENSTFYPSFLWQLYHKNPHHTRLLSKISDALSVKNNSDSLNAKFELSKAICHNFDQHTESLRSKALSYIHEKCLWWEKSNFARTNVDTFSLLIRLSPDSKSQYFSRLEYWHYVKMENERMNLTEQLKSGYHFLLFYNYSKDFSFYELPFDKQNAEVQQLFRSNPKQLCQHFSLAPGESPPPFFDGYSTLNTRFLFTGIQFFRGALPERSDTDKLRKYFNNQARQHLNGLFEIIISLPTIKENMAKALQNHQRMLKQYTEKAIVEQE
ncbi:MAG TPA: hypothetical protein VK154_18370 [Chitinophagales bacterium]|nr:hypothetical protein [Chitinophagales bacterium]